MISHPKLPIVRL